MVSVSLAVGEQEGWEVLRRIQFESRLTAMNTAISIADYGISCKESVIVLTKAELRLHKEDDVACSDASGDGEGRSSYGLPL